MEMELFYSDKNSIPYLAAISVPCCNNTPIVAQKQLHIRNWLISTVGSSMQGNGLSHSPGEMRPRTNKQKETPRYAAPMHSQTPLENGDMKESNEGASLVGLRYRMEIPKFMNGIVKSTAFSRSDVIVKSVMAKSARWKRDGEQEEEWLVE